MDYLSHFIFKSDIFIHYIVYLYSFVLNLFLVNLMPLNLANATYGTRRFIEFAKGQGYNPHPIGLTAANKDIQAITLVYAHTQTYFIVFNPSLMNLRSDIPRSVIRNLIGNANLEKAFRKGEISVRGEMQSGYMSPFVSESLKDFKVFLDYLTFRGNRHLAFPLGTKGNDGFSLQANVFKELLIGLYGLEQVSTLYLFNSD